MSTPFEVFVFLEQFQVTIVELIDYNLSRQICKINKCHNITVLDLHEVKGGG